METQTQPPSPPPQCPNCGSSRVAELFFGMPPDVIAFKRAFDAEKLYHAPGDPAENSPEWHCFACLHEWGTTHLASLLREIRINDGR